MTIASVVSALMVGTVAVSAAAQSQTPPPAAQRPAAPQTQPAAPAAPRPTTPAPAPAAAPAPVPFPTDAKVAFVNMQYIVSMSKLGKSGTDRMKALQDKLGAEEQARNVNLQKLAQEIQSGASVLSAAVLSQKNAEFDRLSREAQFQKQQQDVDVSNLNDQLLGEFTQKVLPIVEQLRAEKSLWMVFSAGEGSSIAAVHPGLDLSAEVVKRLDATN